MSVFDETGKPVRYAEVWRIILPAPKTVSYAFPDDQISTDYLDNVTDRYKDIPEFARPMRPFFYEATYDGSAKAFEAINPTDSSGRTRELVRFDHARTKPVTIKLSGLLYGYSPGQVETVVMPNEHSVSVILNIQRNPEIKIPNEPYWETYNKIRYEFTSYDFKAGNPEMARETLIASATEAQNAGDYKSAARIFSWIPFLPTSTRFDNETGRMKIRGYRREDETSPRNISILEKASQLDPDNNYIKMKRLLLQPRNNLADNIAALEDLVADDREQLWPIVFVYLERLYLSANQKGKAYQEFLMFKDKFPGHINNNPQALKIRLMHYINLDDFVDNYIVDGDPNKEDQYSHLPIFYAVASGRVDLLNWLLENGVRTPLYSPVLYQSISSRNPEMVRRLVRELEQSITGIDLESLEYELTRAPTSLTPTTKQVGIVGKDLDEIVTILKQAIIVRKP